MSRKGGNLKDILGDDDFYVDFHPLCFWPPQPLIEEAPYVVFGVPLDETTVCRPGTRYGPNAIRAATVNFDTYSERAGLDLENVKIHDLGDVLISYGNVLESLRRVGVIFSDLMNAKKVPVILGGEHLLTLGVAGAVQDTAILDFDAHMDARDEYPEGMRLSHATFIRRAGETIGAEKIFQVGVRTYCKEELKFAREQGMNVITSYEIHRKGIASTISRILKGLEGFKKIYVTVDIDVLDTPFTPGTTYPSPEGIDLVTLLDILMKVVDERVIGFDVVEVSPPYDSGNITATNAAKIVLENIAFIQQGRR